MVNISTPGKRVRSLKRRQQYLSFDTEKAPTESSRHGLRWWSRPNGSNRSASNQRRSDFDFAMRWR